jgi:serine phosphatase RsbU (regulator of sigma subunit)
MYTFLVNLAKRINPDIQKASPQQQVGSAADVLTALYSLPFWAAGVVWLVLATDLAILRQNAPILVAIGILMYLVSQVSFYLVTEIRAGGYANSDGTLEGVVLWSAVFIFGPTALWLDAFWALYNFLSGMRRAASNNSRWNRLRSYLVTQAVTQLGVLGAFEVYKHLEGELPFPGLSPQILVAGFAALLVHFVVMWLMWSGYITFVVWSMKMVLKVERARPVLRFMLSAFGFPMLANPFALMAADLYVREGMLLYLFFMGGILLAATLARRLSLAVENARQSSQQLQALEAFSQALLKAPPDGSRLPDLLQEHVPTMFPAQHSLVWTASEQVLCCQPVTWKPEIAALGKWIASQQQARAFLFSDELPWQNGPTAHPAVLTAPVLDLEGGKAIGGVYIELQPLAMPWQRDSLARLVPAVQSLAAQTASALHQARVYLQALENQKMLEQLSLARRIQASFLPEVLPQVPGWDFAAVLEPARVVAGDFYDFIPLPENKLGLLIADVADKGLGPALYMALSRTLIRTFAAQYVWNPETVLAAANARILQDARANLFVTVFYGVLDLESGDMAYCNAGHSPPMRIFSPDSGMQMLGNTGMPLGIETDPTFRREIVRLEPGNLLLLYTDGLTDAQNSQGEFIDRHNLHRLVKDQLGRPARDVQQAILAEIQQFSGSAAQFDDITMMVVVRE